MPEGPEVTYLAWKLNKALRSKKLMHVDILAGRYTKHGASDGIAAMAIAFPLKLERVYNKGKVIVFQFENHHTMISKLGLAGWWVWGDSVDSAKKRWRVRFVFDGEPVYYCDTMNYGTLECTDNPSVLQAEIDKLAPDVLNDKLKWVDLWERINRLSVAKRKWLIEDMLMDQQCLLSGVGNYLKCEILYDAGIAPTRAISSLSEDEWQKIYTSTKTITMRIYESLKKTITPDEYQESRETYDSLAVYKKDTDPLGNKVEQRKSKQGRTTYWAPNVQH